MSSTTPVPSTPGARRARHLRTALSGLVLAGGALLTTAGPALAAPADADHTEQSEKADGAQESSSAQRSAQHGYPRPASAASEEALSYENAEGGGGPSSDPAAIDGQAPTPAYQGAPYGEEKGGPEIAGVPLQGTIDSVTRATSILPGAGPGDYA